MRLILL